MKHFLFVAAEMRVSVVFLCLLLDEVNILGFWTWSILQLHIEPLGTVTGNLFWIFHYRSPEAFFSYCSILKKKKKKVMCVTVNFFFHVSNQVKKKEFFMKILFFTKKNVLCETFVSRVVSVKWFSFFDSSVSFCNAHFGHKRQKCTTALPLVSQVDCCVLSAFSLMCVNSEQWITATERKAKKVHISGTENGLYVSEMEVGEHVVILPFHQHYAWVPPQYFYVYSDHTDCFMCPNCAWQSAVTISLGHH